MVDRVRPVSVSLNCWLPRSHTGASPSSRGAAGRDLSFLLLAQGLAVAVKGVGWEVLLVIAGYGAFSPSSVRSPRPRRADGSGERGFGYADGRAEGPNHRNRTAAFPSYRPVPSGRALPGCPSPLPHRHRHGAQLCRARSLASSSGLFEHSWLNLIPQGHGQAELLVVRGLKSPSPASPRTPSPCAS